MIATGQERPDPEFASVAARTVSMLTGEALHGHQQGCEMRI